MEPTTTGKQLSHLLDPSWYTHPNLLDFLLRKTRYVRRWLADERQGRLFNPEAVAEEVEESQGGDSTGVRRIACLDRWKVQTIYNVVAI